MSSSYLPPFQSLVFKTVFLSSMVYSHDHRGPIPTCEFPAAFAVASTSFYNSSFQANVISRMEIGGRNMELVDLFICAPSKSTSTTTSSNLSTIQMTPVLELIILHPDTLINTLKCSTYFSRSLKQLKVRDDNPSTLLPALENLVALEVLDLCISDAGGPAFSIIGNLPSLVELKLELSFRRDQASGFFDFLGDLENNSGFRKLSIQSFDTSAGKDFQANFARLCARNLLTHLSLAYFVTDDDLAILVDVTLTNLQFFELILSSDTPCSKVPDAIIACSSSLSTLKITDISDDVLIKCAEYLDKLVELWICSLKVNGSFLREKGSCFAGLEILDFAFAQLSNQQLNDGFKYLTSLRKFTVGDNQSFKGFTSLQHLTAARLLDEMELGVIDRSSFQAISQFRQLRRLLIHRIECVEAEDVARLENLINLRELIVGTATPTFYTKMFEIAESFPALEHVKLGRIPYGYRNKRGFSCDEVTHLLEKCWPLARFAEFEYRDDSFTAMSCLRRRFPHVDFGYDEEEFDAVCQYSKRNSNDDDENSSLDAGSSADDEAIGDDGSSESSAEPVALPARRRRSASLRNNKTENKTKNQRQSKNKQKQPVVVNKKKATKNTKKTQPRKK